MTVHRRQLAFVGAGALGVLAMGLGAEASAQSRPTITAPHERDEAVVARAVETYRKGLLTADRGLLEEICADQLSYGHSAGTVQTKAEFIAAATNRKSTWKYITFSDQTVSVVGSNAIVRNIFTGDIESEGKVTPIKIGMLMVWHKQKTHWKLLARQAFKI
jgi:hypothetical protein